MGLERDRKNKLLSPKTEEGEQSFDTAIRPESLRDYIGQDSVKQNLKIFLEAAKQRNEPLDHVLLYGSAGLGKTTLASIIAKEMERTIRISSGPAIERPIDLVIILKGLKDGDILFIDEIHRLKRPIEEILYSAMEDFVLDRVISKGVGAKPVRIPLPRFTLIGATTRSGSLSSPLRARFGIHLSLSFYEPDQIRQILERSAKILKVTVDGEASRNISRRSRGTPRIANRLLRRIRDFAQVKGDGVITEEISDMALRALQIDSCGLDSVDRKILDALIVKYRGRAVGLDTLSACIGEEPENIEEVYEPYLLQMGFLDRTQKGRMATETAYEYMGAEIPVSMVDRCLNL